MNMSAGIFFDGFYLPIQLSFIVPMIEKEGRGIFPPVCLRAAAHAIKPGAWGENQSKRDKGKTRGRGDEL